MAKVTANYEVVYIIDPAQGEEGTAALVAKFRTLAEQNGTDVSVEEWCTGNLPRPELATMHLVGHPFAHGMELLALPHGAAIAYDQTLRALQPERAVVAAGDAQNGKSGLVVPEDNPYDSSVDCILTGISHAAGNLPLRFPLVPYDSRTDVLISRKHNQTVIGIVDIKERNTLIAPALRLMDGEFELSVKRTEHHAVTAILLEYGLLADPRPFRPA